MRRCLFALLFATALLAGGCSHLTADRADGWLARVSDGATEAAVRVGARHGAEMEPIVPSRGGSWADLMITPVSEKGPHAVAHADGPYLLDSGDQLRIFVYGQPNLSRIYTVDHKGNIMMPLIGVVKAQRRTAYALAGAIRSRLGAKYVRDPQVSVDIHQHRPFFILGEVRTPGQYSYVSGMTVETAVAIAGGYTPRARENNFRISRRVDGILEVDRGSRDYVVQPGDTIKVEERFF